MSGSEPGWEPDDQTGWEPDKPIKLIFTKYAPGSQPRCAASNFPIATANDFVALVPRPIVVADRMIRSPTN